MLKLKITHFTTTTPPPATTSTFPSFLTFFTSCHSGIRSKTLFSDHPRPRNNAFKRRPHPKCLRILHNRGLRRRSPDRSLRSNNTSNTQRERRRKRSPSARSLLQFCFLTAQTDPPQSPRQTTLLLLEKGGIRHHQVLTFRRPFLTLHLEHEADLRLRVCIMAELYVHRTHK